MYTTLCMCICNNGDIGFNITFQSLFAVFLLYYGCILDFRPVFKSNFSFKFHLHGCFIHRTKCLLALTKLKFIRPQGNISVIKKLSGY